MTPQDFFKNDLFAERTGIVLMEVREGYSKARLEIKKEHLNAGNRTQGGAIFTLADLALSAAANSHGQLVLRFSVPVVLVIHCMPKPGSDISAGAPDIIR